MLFFIAQGRINTDFIRIIPGKRLGFYIIWQQDNDRHFTFLRDTSAARNSADDPKHLLCATDQEIAICISDITLELRWRITVTVH